MAAGQTSRKLVFLGVLAGIGVGIGLVVAFGRDESDDPRGQASKVTPQPRPPEPEERPPPPVPKSKPKPQPEPGAVPDEAATRFSLEAAPGKFVLGTEHRFFVDRYPMLPHTGMSIDVFPAFQVEFRKPDDLPGTPRPEVQMPLFLFERTADGLSARQVPRKFVWKGGKGWLLGVISAVWPLRVTHRPMAYGGGSKGNKDLRASVVTVDATSSFRVRSLPAVNTWSLTVTSVSDAGEAVVPPVMHAFPVEGLTREVWLDGKPMDRGMALVAPGAHKLYGARELWLSVPTSDSLKTSPLEIELAELPGVPDAAPPLRGASDKQAFERSYGGAGRVNCAGITEVGPMATLTKEKVLAFRLSLGAEPPLLVVQPLIRPPKDAKKDTAGAIPQPAAIMESARSDFIRCKVDEGKMRLGRSRPVDKLETSLGEWKGQRVEFNDLIFKER